MSSSPTPELTIRRAEARDHDDVWRIFHEVVRAGDTYVFPPDTAREEALRLWMPNDWVRSTSSSCTASCERAPCDMMSAPPSIDEIELWYELPTPLDPPAA